jgi:hypothetical protein
MFFKNIGKIGKEDSYKSQPCIYLVTQTITFKRSSLLIFFFLLTKFFLEVFLQDIQIYWFFKDFEYFQKYINILDSNVQVFLNEKNLELISLHNYIHNLTSANTSWVDDIKNLQTQIDSIKSNVPLLKDKQYNEIVELNRYIHSNSPLNEGLRLEKIKTQNFYLKWVVVTFSANLLVLGYILIVK